MGRYEADTGERLTLQDISKQTGISSSVLSKMSDPQADYATTTRHLELICRFFGVTADGLVVFDPPIEEESTSRYRQPTPTDVKKESETG